MGRTACTEPQYLYKGALYLYLYITFRFYHKNTSWNFLLRYRGQMHRPSCRPRFYHSNDIWRALKNRKLRHYEVSSVLLSLPPWQLRTFSSPPCSQTPSAPILPSCKTKFHVLQRTWHDSNNSSLSFRRWNWGSVQFHSKRKVGREGGNWTEFTSSNSVLCCYWINPLKLKRRPLYLKTQSVPRCKNFSSGL